MNAQHENWQRDFEHALFEFLEQDHDLRVRKHGDNFERRTDGYATLDFKYSYDATHPSEAKVVVQIVGDEPASFTIVADFSTPQTIQSSAEDCEDLAESLGTSTPTFDEYTEDTFWDEGPRARLED